MWEFRGHYDLTIRFNNTKPGLDPSRSHTRLAASISRPSSAAE